jgi:hypothetical protein
MKTLNIPFEDREFKNLNMSKQDYESDKGHSVSWKEFIFIMLEVYEGQNEE